MDLIAGRSQKCSDSAKTAALNILSRTGGLLLATAVQARGSGEFIQGQTSMTNIAISRCSPAPVTTLRAGTLPAPGRQRTPDPQLPSSRYCARALPTRQT